MGTELAPSIPLFATRSGNSLGKLANSFQCFGPVPQKFRPAEQDLRHLGSSCCSHGLALLDGIRHPGGRASQFGDDTPAGNWHFAEGTIGIASSHGGIVF